MKEAFAIAAFVVSIAANVPYIIDTLRGRAKPERVSWLLWTLHGLTYYASAVFADGAALFTFGELVGPGLIFLLALKYGVGGRNRLDNYSLLVALLAFGLLFIVDGVLVGLLLALFIDCIGAMLTLRKLVRDRTSESRGFWLLGAVASLLALVSLQTYNLDTMLFPIYVFVLSSIVVYLARPAGKHDVSN